MESLTVRKLHLCLLPPGKAGGDVGGHGGQAVGAAADVAGGTHHGLTDREGQVAFTISATDHQLCREYIAFYAIISTLICRGQISSESECWENIPSFNMLEF